MNAPAPLDLLGQYLPQIPLTQIQPSGSRTQALRRQRFSEQALQELADTFKEHGIAEPLIVRPHPAPKGDIKYEIVAGERRYLAAPKAGLASVPVIVRELSDGAVLRLQLIENLQREDLGPLEEAQGYQELMELDRIKADDVGNLVGKSRAWVYSRINLLKLPEIIKDALQHERIDVSRALLVASVAEPERQARVLRDATERNGVGNPLYSVRQLRTRIVREREVIPLVGAPFPIDDAGLLPKAGACGPCPHRTANCDPESADPNLCTNAACYHDKVRLHGDRRRQEIKAAGGKVLRGEEARRLSPSVKTVYDHVDLDLVCPVDHFSEEEPKPPKNLSFDLLDDWENTDPAMAAWREREEAWQPRTYRALLAGEQFESVLIDDPKTKLLRELVPFKTAQALLKKKGIDLPSHYNRKRQTFRAAGPDSKPEKAPAKKTPAQEAAEKAAAELEDQVAKLSVQRLMQQVRAKHSGQLGLSELARIAVGLSQQLDWQVEIPLWNAFGVTNVPNWNTAEAAVIKLGAKELPRFITAVIVGLGMEGDRSDEKAAETILATLKIDSKKIEAEARAELTPKKTEAAQPLEKKPAKAAAKKAAKKPAKKGGKK